MELIHALAHAIAYELSFTTGISDDMDYEILCSDVQGYDFDCLVNMSWRYTPATHWQPSEVNPIIHYVNIKRVWNSEGEKVSIDIDEKRLAEIIHI